MPTCWITLKTAVEHFKIPFALSKGERGFGMLTKWVNVRKPFMLRQAQHERLSHVPTAVFRIIAGPNGAGKTTFALEYLPQVAKCSRFVNADLIAAGLSPLAPERELLAASRLFLAEIEVRIQQREDFAFETTLAGRSYLKMVRRLRAEGWRIELIYLALPSIEMSRLRVAERVAHGGHHIPTADIERRFGRSLSNLFEVFSIAVDNCRCYMNIDALPELIFEQQGELRSIVHAAHYQYLLEQAIP